MVTESHGGKARGGNIAMAGVILSLSFVEPYSTQAQPLPVQFFKNPSTRIFLL